MLGNESASRREMKNMSRKSMREFKKFFWFLVVLLLLFRLSYFLISSGAVEDERNCSSPGCFGERIWGRRLESMVVEEISRVFEEAASPEVAEEERKIESIEEFFMEMKRNRPDVGTFALKLKAMVSHLEHKARAAKIQSYLYRHVASSSIPKNLHCLTLTLAEEYSINADARRQLPAAEATPALVNNSLHHFVLASDNVIAAAAVAASLSSATANPSLVVLHVVTDRKAYAAMHAWFSLHPLDIIIEVKELYQFEWFAKGKVPVLEAMEKDRVKRVKFQGGSSAIVEASEGERPGVVAAKLQTLNPKYYSVMNHIRINLPEMFPTLKKVVFLDDDIIIQSDLSPLWDIDLKGKVNGAVETCTGGDNFVMSKRLKSYLNFSQPLIYRNFDPEECAWAYGMNIFDLEAWRKTNITRTYNNWLQLNVASDLTLWQLGTLPPGLIAFHGHVHVIEPRWHMLGLGYQENPNMDEVHRAAVIHFNGRAKPWLDIAFPNLRSLWTRHLDFSDSMLDSCNIRPA